MGDEWAATREEFEAELVELKAQRMAILELGKVVNIEKEKSKEVRAGQETIKNLIAAEKSERLDQVGGLNNRLKELENWVSTQVRPFCPLSWP